MKVLVVEAYFRTKDPLERENLRNDILNQIKTGVVVTDTRRIKVTPCEVDCVMIKDAEEEMR